MHNLSQQSLLALEFEDREGCRHCLAGYDCCPLGEATRERSALINALLAESFLNQRD
jgi:hypothetical protein